MIVKAPKRTVAEQWLYEDSVELASYVSLQTSDNLPLGLALGGAFFDVGLGALIRPCARERPCTGPC